MASIQFSADLDTTKLEAAIKQSNQTVGDWVKGVESGANAADVALQKTGAQLKADITAQKQLIKEIEADIKSLQKTADNTAPGKNKSGALGELAGAKKALAEEQGALIGMQKQAIAANALEAESINPVVAGMWKWAAGLATVAAAMKIGKAIIEATETTAHAFEQVTTAAASATGVLFKAIATGDWSNFQQGMDRAVKGALEYVDAMEKLANMQNEQTIRSSKLDIEIGKQRANSFSTDPKVVKAALTELVKLQKQKLTEEAGLVKIAYDNDLKKAADDNNINGKWLQQKIEYYSKNREIIEKGEAYNLAMSNNEAAIRGRNDYGGEKRYQENKKALEELTKELGSKASDYGKQASDFNKVPIPQRTALANQLAKSNTAFAAIDINNRRDKQRLTGIEKQEEQDAIAEAKRIRDEKNRQSLEQINYDTKIGRQRIDNQIALEQGLLDTQKDGAEKERAQADLDYRKTLNDIAKNKADQLAELNKVGGGIDKGGKPIKGKYIGTLKPEDQAQLDQQAVIAKQKLANDIIAIEEKQAEKVRVIEDQLHDYRLTGIAKEKEAVKDKYDKEEKLALEAMRFDLVASVAETRGKANAEIDRKYALQEIDYQEQIDIQKATLSINNEDDLQKKLFEIWKNAQLQRVGILQNGTPEEKKQAKLITGDVAVETKKDTKKTTDKTVKDLLEIGNAAISAGNDVGAMFDSYGNDKLAGDVQTTTELLSSVATTGQGVAKIMAGDIVGGVQDVIKGVTGFITTLNKLHDKKFENDIIALQKQVDALKISYDDLGKSIARAYSTNKAEIINQETENLKKQNALIQQQKEDEMWKKKSDQSKIDAYNAQIKANNEQIAENTKYNAIEAIMGSDIKSAIDDFANAYADAWAAGEDAAAKSTDIVAKLIRTAIIEMLKNELAPEVTEFMTFLAGALKDGVIDPAEQLIIDGFVNKLNDEADKILKPTGNLIKNNLGTASSTLTGSIKRDLTEQTGGELAGLLRKSSDDGRVTRDNSSKLVDYAKLGLDHLINIDKNTYDTNQSVLLAVTELQKVSKNTGQPSLRGF